jgi:RyR domain-containing protein
MAKYTPRPINTAEIKLPKGLKKLLEQLAEHNHDVWATQRMRDGWKIGETRDDNKKRHPCLLPYAELPESEKDYDRNTVLEVIKAIMALGYRIQPDSISE